MDPTKNGLFFSGAERAHYFLDALQMTWLAWVEEPCVYGKQVTVCMESHPVLGESQVVTLSPQGLRLCVRKHM